MGRDDECDGAPPRTRIDLDKGTASVVLPGADALSPPPACQGPVTGAPGPGPGPRPGARVGGPVPAGCATVPAKTFDRESPSPDSLGKCSQK
ncbi:DUF6191 domain-containing protein [Streptomyces sp. NPDC054854]